RSASAPSAPKRRCSPTNAAVPTSKAPAKVPASTASVQPSALNFSYSVAMASPARADYTLAMETPLDERVEHVLQEARMVLPGTQVLLGMQFQIILMDRFQKLPESSRWTHLASLGMGCLAIILLETPAAYHRLAVRGQDTERLHQI